LRFLLCKNPPEALDCCGSYPQLSGQMGFNKNGRSQAAVAMNDTTL